MYYMLKVYNGHTDMVKCIAVEPEGQWLASGITINYVSLHSSIDILFVY